MSETHLYRRLQDIAVHKMSLRHGKKIHCFSALFYLIFLRKKALFWCEKFHYFHLFFYADFFSFFVCFICKFFHTFFVL